MNEILKDKEVLAMYDIRGIQKFIFNTNTIKEIVGASALVEHLQMEGMKAVISAHAEWKKEQFLMNWEERPSVEFWQNPEIRMQVLFIGGGNAFVLFRTGELCSQMNRGLARYVLEHTYSLQLAVAVVAYTGNYKNDYRAVNLKMREIKAKMPEGKPLGALPFMAADAITGYPLTWYDKQDGYLCTESFKKREKYFEVNGNFAAEKILDNMVTQKGQSSTLAVIHIDGNNMGKRIMEIMQDKEGYPEAVTAMRTISLNIQKGFSEAFDVMAEYIDQKLADKIKPNHRGKLYRKLILAGDDVTFICNAQAAVEAVTAFLQHVTTKRLYAEPDRSEAENQQKYGFSACAGIAFFHSHFPFSDAYQVAEACCVSAKDRAKQTENRDAAGNIGSFMDYQLCSNINAAELDEYRNRHYIVDGTKKMIIYRPYYVNSPVLNSYSDLNQRNAQYDVEILKENIRSFQSDLPRSQAKKLRDTFSLGNREVEKYRTFLRSRSAACPHSPVDTWYDALELMDLYIGKEESRK